jgi:hypothetical protein
MCNAYTGFSSPDLAQHGGQKVVGQPSAGDSHVERVVLAGRPQDGDNLRPHLVGVCAGVQDHGAVAGHQRGAAAERRPRVPAVQIQGLGFPSPSQHIVIITLVPCSIELWLHLQQADDGRGSQKPDVSGHIDRQRATTAYNNACGDSCGQAALGAGKLGSQPRRARTVTKHNRERCRGRRTRLGSCRRWPRCSHR